MRISDLEQRLRNLRIKHGDLPVVVIFYVAGRLETDNLEESAVSYDSESNTIQIDAEYI